MARSRRSTARSNRSLSRHAYRVLLRGEGGPYAWRGRCADLFRASLSPGWRAVGACDASCLTLKPGCWSRHLPRIASAFRSPHTLGGPVERGGLIVGARAAWITFARNHASHGVRTFDPPHRHAMHTATHDQTVTTPVSGV